MFGRVSINIIKLGKIWKIQLVILAYPAFRGQEFKGKRALWLLPNPLSWMDGSEHFSLSSSGQLKTKINIDKFN